MSVASARSAVSARSEAVFSLMFSIGTVVRTKNTERIHNPQACNPRRPPGVAKRLELFKNTTLLIKKIDF